MRELILGAREGIARTVNAGLATLYWHVGDRIRREVLQEKRASYGEEIVATLSQQLTHEFGKGWELSALRRMIRFSEAFPDFEIVATLSHQLGWSHFVEIIPMKDDLKRDFYAEM